ncbi:MAG: protein translocase subunit SecF [Candidatus Aenigmarchaeota archaeon]|nr:protein translocase subunit SecF [Candidatus Aenigmarchaeota archaeon]
MALHTIADKFLHTKESKSYRKFLIVTLILILMSVAILGNRYYQTGEFFDRSIDLKGGTLITVNTNANVDIIELENLLKGKFGDVNVRRTTGIGTPSIIAEVAGETDADAVLAEMGNFGIDTGVNSIQTIGTSLGSAFWSQAQIGIMAAFVIMGIIVFIMFRKPVPSILVIACAVFDITTALAFMQVFGVQFSLASLAAILMLIGYSVDTDIMLTSRLLKETDAPFTERFRRSLKTGLTETITSIVAVSALVISAISPVLSEIAAVLLIGLFADIIYTWTMNSVLLRWYMDKKGMI